MAYDNDRYDGKHVVYVGVSGTLLGTVADNGLGAELFKLPANFNGKITGATIKVTNGGTGAAAAPSFGIATGGTVVLASAVYGTRADNTYVNLAASTTNTVDAGDILYLCYVAGTIADTSQVFTLQTIEYQERFA
jgi:hypothetical protein